MRPCLIIAACLPLVAIATPPEETLALPAGTVACEVTLNVTDPDPNGLNVRAGPTAKSSVVAVLKSDGDWISVHVIGQNGEWLQIDNAWSIIDSGLTGQHPIMNKRGWVHASKLGISELYTGSGTVLRDRPAADGTVLSRIRDEDSTATPVLGCRGKFIKVRHQHVVGWTDRWCNNERTTCS